MGADVHFLTEVADAGWEQGHTGRVRSAGAGAPLVAGSQLLSTAASAQGQAATQRVIVVLNNQDPSQPANRADIGRRRTSFRSSQSSDARQPTSTQLSLSALNSPDTTVPLTSSQPVPVFLMPTDTTAFSATASTTGSTPIEFDSEGPAGDPDVGSTVGSSVVGNFSAPEVSPGDWDVAPDVVGAFGTTGAPQEPVSTTMTATSAAFDPTVGSQTGELWQGSTNPSSLDGFSPITVGPGQTGRIPVTITPAGAAGRTDSGTLYVDDTDAITFQNFVEPNGSQVAALPYSYTVK